MKNYNYDTDDIWGPGRRSDIENTAFTLYAMRTSLLDDIAAKAANHFRETGNLNFNIDIPNDLSLTDAEEEYINKRIEELILL